MKQIQSSIKFIVAVALLALASGCATTPNKVNLLVASGFKIVVPKNAAQEAKLQTLQPGKVSQVQKNGKTYYVYPDIAHNQAYVGGVQQYNYYKVLRSKQQVSTENLEEANENRPISSDVNWSSDSDWGGNGW
jgi:hypothetical protein